MSRPYQGRMIVVQRVAHTACIAVHGVKPIKDEMIAMHFENPRRSGGGEVKSVTKRNDVAVVEFKDRHGDRPIFYRATL